MAYLLVQNKQIVILGPMSWKPRFIQSEIDLLVEDGEIAERYIIPPVEQGYIDLGSGFEIFPIVGSSGLENFDPLYEQPVGPFYTYADNQATETYSTQPLEIDNVKNNLKSIAAAERYRREISSVTVTVAGTPVIIFTDRDNRPQYTNLLATIGTNTVNWKFVEGFLPVALADAQNIVNAINSYVQAQFDWEKSIDDAIDAATTVDQLKAISILKPVQPITNTIITSTTVDNVTMYTTTTSSTGS